MNSRKRQLVPLAALVLLAGFGSQAPAQLPPIPTTKNTDVAYPPVSEHAPRIATLRTGGQSSMELFAITKSGLSYRYFTRVTGSVDAPWGNWVHRGAPSPQAGLPETWRRSLPATGGWYGQGNDLLAFFDVPDNTSSERIAVADLGNYSGSPPAPTTFAFSLQDPGFGTGGIPAERFNPRTVLTSPDSQSVDVFGTSDDVGASNLQTPLLRLHGSHGVGGWTWTATNLMRPNLPPINGVSPDARVGPQAGATFLLGTPAVATHLVFVKAKYSSEDHVTFVTGTTNGGAFSWGGVDLGSPRSNAQIIDEPVALFYQWGTFTRVCVFATAFNRTTNRYELFERHFDATPGASPTIAASWTAWQSFGAPPNLNPQTKFRITTDVAWYQGSTLRINMFGHADSDTSAPERMVEFYWNGSSWQWGGLRQPPNGTGIRTSCAVVLQATNYTRITVLGRTAGDASFPGAGSIWEMYWTSENGVDHDWTWRDLSWEPAFTKLGF
jgi:hypothetical protein